MSAVFVCLFVCPILKVYILISYLFIATPNYRYYDILMARIKNIKTKNWPVVSQHPKSLFVDDKAECPSEVEEVLKHLFAMHLCCIDDFRKNTTVQDGLEEKLSCV